MLESESFGQIRQESWNWFVRVFTNRAMAFVTIQSQVMPLLATKADSELFLTLLQIYIRDALLVSRGVEGAVIQSDKLATMKSFANHHTVSEWIKEHEKNDQRHCQSRSQRWSASSIRTMGIKNPKIR